MAGSCCIYGWSEAYLLHSKWCCLFHSGEKSYLFLSLVRSMIGSFDCMFKSLFCTKMYCHVLRKGCIRNKHFNQLKLIDLIFTRVLTTQEIVEGSFYGCMCVCVLLQRWIHGQRRCCIWDVFAVFLSGALTSKYFRIHLAKTLCIVSSQIAY